MDQSLRPIPLGNEKAKLIPEGLPITVGHQLFKLRGGDNREGEIACHEWVSLDFRCGSQAEVQRGPRNVRCWGESGSRFRATGGLLLAISGHWLKPKTIHPRTITESLDRFRTRFG